MKQINIAIAFLLILNSCIQQGPNFQFKKEAKIKQLGVKFIYSDTLYDVLKEDFDFKLDSYISKYNAKHHAYTLYKTENGDSNAITFHVKSIKLATKKEQILATAGSLAGLTIPPILMVSAGASFIAVVWFYPTNKVKIEFSLSPDLAKTNSKRIQNSTFTTRASYWGGQNKHIQKVCKYNFRQISFLFKKIENQYIYQQKYYGRTK